MNEDVPSPISADATRAGAAPDDVGAPGPDRARAAAIAVVELQATSGRRVSLTGAGLLLLSTVVEIILGVSGGHHGGLEALFGLFLAISLLCVAIGLPAWRRAVAGRGLITGAPEAYRGHAERVRLGGGAQYRREGAGDVLLRLLDPVSLAEAGVVRVAGGRLRSPWEDIPNDGLVYAWGRLLTGETLVIGHSEAPVGACGQVRVLTASPEAEAGPGPLGRVNTRGWPPRSARRRPGR